MTKSALQIARAAYQPKLPKALKGAVKVKEGEPTQSVADQEAITALFFFFCLLWSLWSVCMHLYVLWLWGLRIRLFRPVLQLSGLHSKW